MTTENITENKIKNFGSKFKTVVVQSITSIKENFVSIGADVIGWCGLILVNVATIPTLLAILTGMTEKMPPVDMILFMWAGMFLFFIRSVINKELLNIITIGIGFLAQATLLALILFK